MQMKSKYLLSSLVLISLLFVSGIASAHPLNAPVGTGFTYQGKLTDGGTPANGTYDFEFKLYDALIGGSQVGSTVTQGDVTVTAGLFTVQLDFGNIFDGTALWLEIGVRPGASVGVYTALTPRQQLSATPYAIYASKVPWMGITGIPAGFADGIDNGSAYQNVKIVAKSGGDFTTITAALASITTASPTNHYLVYVAPGVYSEQVTMKPYVDIEGAGELTTKITQVGSASFTGTAGTVLGASNAELRFLTVENTGGANYALAINNSSASPRLTHVTATASGGTFGNYGVSNASSTPTMTNVTATASGGTESYGVVNNSSSPTMTNVTATATASGGERSYGVYNASSSSPTMTNVTANASGGTYNYGVYNNSTCSPRMTNVTATSSGGWDSIGVYNDASSSPTMTDVTATASEGTNNYGVANNSTSSPRMTNVIANASGGTKANGVYNSASSPMMTNVTATASGASTNNGVYNASSSPTMTNVTATASGGTYNYGIYNKASSGDYTVTVNNSQITGSTNTIFNDTPFFTKIGASQLSGGPIASSGFVICVGVYDENYASPGYTICP
jgi:hypothetical protein